MKTAAALAVVVLWALPLPAYGEVPLKTASELEADASHIVVGKVAGAFSHVEEDKKWRRTQWVAQISVDQSEKGSGIAPGGTIYVHYWNQGWIGEGEPEPYASGHEGVKKGDKVRVYLDVKDGVYHVLLPNGFTPLKREADK